MIRGAFSPARERHRLRAQAERRTRPGSTLTTLVVTAALIATSVGSLVGAKGTLAATVHASDTFSRTVVNSWGSATTGGAWTLSPAGNAADFDVPGSAGTMTMLAGANRGAVLASVSAQDVDLSFRVTTDRTAVGGNQYIYGIARRINASTEYRAKLRFATNGAVYVQGTAVVNNVETGIGSEVLVSGLTRSAGAFVRVRAQFQGSNPTTVRIRAWADAGTEPSTWQYTQTNAAAALQVAGGVGARAYLAAATTNAPVVVTFDDLAATGIEVPAPVAQFRVNEVESSDGANPDWVELVNAGPTASSLAGWTIKDDDDAHAYTFGQGVSLGAGGLLVVDGTQLGFGLGQPDSVRLFAPNASLADATSWTTHASPTWGRCPSGSGVFANTAASTKGSVNVCTGTVSSWPGGTSVQTADSTNAFPSNLSGLTYEGTGTASPGVLWAVRNGPELVYRLVWDSPNAVWTPDVTNGWTAGKQLRYPDGTGQPDSEGLTLAGPDQSGRIFVAAERNNQPGFNTVSRASVLRVRSGQCRRRAHRGAGVEPDRRSGCRCRRTAGRQHGS